MPLCSLLTCLGLNILFLTLNEGKYCFQGFLWMKVERNSENRPCMREPPLPLWGQPPSVSAQCQDTGSWGTHLGLESRLGYWYDIRSSLTCLLRPSHPYLWMGLPCGSYSKESGCSAGDLGSVPWEDPLEKEMATHSTILAWWISWTEEPGRLQSMGSESDMTEWLNFIFFWKGTVEVLSSEGSCEERDNLCVTLNTVKISSQ